MTSIQGYIDEITLTHAIGWIRDLDDPLAIVSFDVLVGDRIVGSGQADQFYAPFDRHVGFRIVLPALTAAERAALAVRPQGWHAELNRAPIYQGYLDQRSSMHVGGWVRNRFDPTARVQVEAALAGNVIATGTADRFCGALAKQNIGDAFYGFLILFPEPLSDVDRERLEVRPVGGAFIEHAPQVESRFDLVSYAAMDIVNNCNLRCPFCLFDYSDTKSTRFMSDQTFDAALRLLPLVGDAGFWLSCLHEPSLHPKFLQFIARIPREWRRKVMFTTNLAKRMNEAYFVALADSGVFHINISIESMDPPVYEKFRKGARFSIFHENWERLLAAWRAHESPPRLRYIIMAYQTNLREIPQLVAYLRNERLAWQIEVRYTLDLSHIPDGFRRAEYLEPPDWAWLAMQLGLYPASEVILTAPWEAPDLAAAHEPAPVPAQTQMQPPQVAPLEDGREPPADRRPVYPVLPLNLQVSWDGRFLIRDKFDHPDDQRELGMANIIELVSPIDFLVETSRLPILRLVQGYIDELSTTRVTGWMRDAIYPDYRVPFRVAVAGEAGTRFIAEGCADGFYQALKDYGWKDADHGFHLEFETPLTLEERDSLEILPAKSATPLRRAPRYQGYVDARTTHYVSGWLRNRFAPEERVAFEAALPVGNRERIVGTGIADGFLPELVRHQVGDARYGFTLQFSPPLTEAERDALVVRPALGRTPLALSPRLLTEAE